MPISATELGAPVVSCCLIGRRFVAMVSPHNALRKASEGCGEYPRPVYSVVAHQRAETHHYETVIAGARHEPFQIARQRRWVLLDGESTHQDGVRVNRCWIVDSEVRVDEPTAWSKK